MEKEISSGSKSLPIRQCRWWRAPALEVPRAIEDLGTCHKNGPTLHWLCDRRFHPLKAFPCVELISEEKEEPRFFGH